MNRKAFAPLRNWNSLHSLVLAFLLLQIIFYYLLSLFYTEL